MMRRFSLITSFWLLAAGCKKPAPPERPANDLDSVERYSLDNLESLRRHCLTNNIEGCDVVRNLAATEAALRALHRAEVEEEQQILEALLALLKAEDEPPVVRITSVPLNTDALPRASASLSGSIELRSEVPRGFDSMGPETAASFKSLVSRLYKTVKTHQEKFDQRLEEAPRAFELPPDLAEARKGREIILEFQDGTGRVTVPAATLRGLSFDRPAPWVAMVSHVMTDDGLPYRAVDNHRLRFPAPVTVSFSPAGLKIVERKESAGKTAVESDIPASAICNTLRGELRFVRADQTPRLQASFIAADPRSGGDR